MNYSINQIPKVDPQYIVANGARGPETRLNPGPVRQTPLGGARCIYQELSGLYGDDPTLRVELWEDAGGVATDAEIFASCSGLRDWAASLIRSGGNARLLQIANPYQPSERETWPVQMAEAEAWLADNAKPTPMIDAICAARGIDRPTLISYIMANTNLFRQASGAILGQQQALLMQIYVAATVDAVLGVAWP